MLLTIPLTYTLRHLRVRWRSTVATLLCMALVVAVFVMFMSLAKGLKATYISSGDPRNLLVLRKGSMAESSSQGTLENVRQTRCLDGIALNEKDEPIASSLTTGCIIP